MKTWMIVALGFIAPAFAGVADDAALARELLVCGGKFGSLSFVGQSGGEAEAFRFYEAAEKIAGPGVVQREMPAANEKAADWVFSKEGTKPTLEAARKSCLPVLERAQKRRIPRARGQ